MGIAEDNKWFMDVSFGPLETVPCALCGSEKSETVAVQRMFGEEFHITSCGSCGLLFTNPRPTSEWRKRYYDPGCNPLMRLAEREFIYLPPPERICAHGKLLDFMKTTLPAGGSLLDGGCAAGMFVKMASERGFKATGCDYSSSALDYAKEIFGLDLIRAEVQDLPVPDESFDMVTLLHVFEHFSDPIKALREIRRVLKPGGHLLIETVNYFPHYLLEKYFRFLQPIYLKESGKEMIPWMPFDHYFFWTTESLARALEKSGYTEIKTHFIFNYKAEMPDGKVSLPYSAYSAAVGGLFRFTGGKANLWNVLLTTAGKGP